MRILPLVFRSLQFWLQSSRLVFSRSSAIVMMCWPILSVDGQAHDVAQEMAAAAQTFVRSLDADQKAAVEFDFDDPLRKDWQFIPMQRQGLSLKQMQSHQRGLAVALVQTALSHRGFATSTQIMALEEVLFELSNNREKRDPAKYHVFLFGQPSTESSWGWRFEGHHLSISLTLVGGQQVMIAPSFMGASPATVETGRLTGLRPLGDIEDAGRQFAQQLTDGQKKQAILTGRPPRDVINGPGRTATPLQPAGVPAAQLDAAQQRHLMALLNSYLTRYRAELAETDQQKIRDAGLDQLYFAWAGETQPGRPHYFRIQGPTFIFEYDNTQNNANHIHVLWRDFENDFGQDALRRHYQSSHHHGKTIKPKAVEKLSVPGASP